MRCLRCRGFGRVGIAGLLRRCTGVIGGSRFGVLRGLGDRRRVVTRVQSLLIALESF